MDDDTKQMIRKKRVHIFCSAIGCGRMSYHTQKLAKYFIANDCDIVWNPRKADINILTTCACTKIMESAALTLVNRFKKYGGELIVLGCLPGIDPGRLKREFNGRSLPTKDLGAIDAFFPDFKARFRDIPEPTDLFTDRSMAARLRKYRNLGAINGFIKKAWTCYLIPFIHEFEPSRAFIAKFIKRQLDRMRGIPSGNTGAGGIIYLRIGNGCLGNCSYCAIRFATGELRSKPLDECMREFTDNLRRGSRRFRLLGEDAGAYGLDRGSSFPELLSGYEEASVGIPYKLYIEAISPWWVIRYKDKIVEMAEAGRIQYIGCNIESGSERILRLMNRYSDLKAITGTLSEIKAADRGIEFHSCCIAGFPSETEEDFNATLCLMSNMDFIVIALMPYSDMAVTEAYKMTDKVPAEVIKRRMGLAVRTFQKSHVIRYYPKTRAYDFTKK